MTYHVTKTYGHSTGLSCAFRQWRAESHCRFIHGYSLAISLRFDAETLNDKNWVIDFGGLKAVKQFLTDTFDHKLLIAADDPAIDILSSMGGLGLAQPVVLPHVGCEAFAEYIFDWVAEWLSGQIGIDGVLLAAVEVCEHDGNSASYSG